MWTKNGANTLAPVLRRIGEVIPTDCVNKRLIIDDKSTDKTRQIAGSFGWQVIPNEGNGISDGANTALQHVETDYFASFEQDLFLSRDWWHKIPLYFSDPKVAIASGIRFDYYPAAVKKIQEYTAEKYKVEDRPGRFFPYVKTLDNTIYRTRAIRRIGGFPKLPMSVGVDHALSQRIHQSAMLWKVDYKIHSIHLRQGLREEFEHNYWYGRHSNELQLTLFRKNAEVRSLMIRVLLSPLRGMDIALRKNTPQAIYIYPLIRLHFLRGVLDSRRVT